MKKNFSWSIYLTSFLLSVIVLLAFYFALFTNKIYPNIRIAGIDISNKNSNEAIKLLSENIKVPEKIILTNQDKKYQLEAKDIDLKYNFEKSVERAYSLNRTGNFLYDLTSRLKLLIYPSKLGLITTLDEEDLLKFISITSEDVGVEPIYPTLKISNSSVAAINGKAGSKVDALLLRSLIGERLANAKDDEVIIPIIEVDPTLDVSKLKKYEERANILFDKYFGIKFEFFTEEILGQRLLNLINPGGGFNKEKIKTISSLVASKVNREPQEPKFVFEDNKVKEFAPAKDGIEVKTTELDEKILNILEKLETSAEKGLTIDVPVISTSPKITTDQVNNLGINTLIGRGTSKYKGSIPSRIHNVATATAKVNGILIKPGETISFNDALGDVSKFTGYQTAYVIKDGKTVLGDGGGVCQVSTTLFRAALNAGLEITERRAHAYRVGYYEQDGGPGIDATVYSPSPDLKIKNNTPAHILIQATADSKNQSLVFELYGTSDGRIVEVTKPVVASVIAAGPDVYIDDPTLPAGTLKQTEHKASGAKVSFNYKVTRNGEKLIDTKFVSNYRPWAAVYLRGTGPIN